MACAQQNWCAIVDRMARGDESAVEDLYRGLESIRAFFRRNLGAEYYEDAYQELMMDLLAQIQSGKLREPERLEQYAFTIARIKVIRGLRQVVRDRSSDPLSEDITEPPETSANPESVVARREVVGMAMRVLEALQPRERAVLTRFYFDGDSPEEIQAELELNQTQFRLIKSRAKARFKELCQARLAGGIGYPQAPLARAI
jgi:RNA polymerase sigma factor (sigma-70 family)